MSPRRFAPDRFHRIRVGVVLALGLVGGTRGAADELPPIQVNPNRPTFATPALTTQEGVAELELGLQRSELRDGGRNAWSPFLLKLGLLRTVELRLGGIGFLRQSPAGAAATSGFGDTTLGVQWTYLPHGPLGVDQALQVTWKFPTASAAKGLGSGETDRTAMLLLSRDFGPFHADANALVTWLGLDRSSGGGTAQQPAATLCVSRTISERWSLTGELYAIGKTSQNPRIVSNLWAVGYKVSSRLVLDGALDLGLTRGAPRVSFLAGFTTGLGRFRRPAAPPR